MEQDTTIASMTIITNVGTAKSMYIEAVELARKGDIAGAEKKMEEGHAIFLEGHKAHAQVLSESSGAAESSNINMLLMHAEDQLMSAETVYELAQQLIAVYQVLIANGLTLSDH
jgi:PTS system cellobiose-specific IIA component